MSDQPLLVVGADGMLGSKLVVELGHQGNCVWQSTRHRDTVDERRVYLDLANDISHFAPPFQGAGTAVLCAAQTSISECQKRPAETSRINVDNTVALAKQLVDAGLFVIFLSSNTVFDGSSAFAAAGDPVSPQNEYGRQKVAAEAQLLSLGAQIAVIRFGKILASETPLLAGWTGNLRAAKPVHPFSDAMMSPVSVAFALTVIGRVTARRRAGITQTSANEDISYEQAARYIAAKIGADGRLVQPISWKDVDVPQFPDHTTLDSTELKLLGLNAPPPTVALDQYINPPI